MREEQPSLVNMGHCAIQVGRADGDVTIVQMPASPPTESELQARFERATGIRCGRAVRERMEHLMENHGFTSWELSRAWKASALVSDRQTAQLRRDFGRLDLLMGWTGMAMATLYFLAGMLESVLLLRDALFMYMPIAAALGCLLYVGTLGFFFYVFIWPQHTAKRVTVALQSAEAINQKAAMTAAEDSTRGES